MNSFGTSFRYETVPPTESTTPPTSVGAGPSYAPCQHRARSQSTPCPHCEANSLHRRLRQTLTLYHGPRHNQPPRSVSTRRFTAYDEEAERAVREERIFRRQPTQITWCAHCRQENCVSNCSTTAFEDEAAKLRGDTPKAAPIEEGYSSSETLRPGRREILYSPALARKMRSRNAAIQTKQPRVRNQATQTEVETLPLRALPLIGQLVYLVLILATASIALAGLAAIPGAHARPLTATENQPSSAAHLFRAFAAISLITVVMQKFIATVTAAPYPEIPALPEANTAAIAAFCVALATAAAYAWQGGNEEALGREVVAEEILRHERWEDFLRDPTHPDFAEWRGEGSTQYTKIIPDSFTKAHLRAALVGLYSRILAAHETAKRTDDFIEWMKNNSPADALVTQLMHITGKDTGEGGLSKVRQSASYMQHQYDHVWTLFPEVPANRRSSVVLLSYIQKLRGLWNAVGSRAAGYTRANGLPIDLGELKDLEEWLNNAPREFEKDVAMLFTPRPKTRDEILKRVQGLIESTCSHPLELAETMRNPPDTNWEDSLQGIENLLAFAPEIDSWGKVLTYAASLSERQDESKLKIENDALREQLDAANMRLELLKGTTGGGPQKYTVPLFDTCFTDICSWNTWRNQALAWAKENPMVLGTPANALSWFSRLLSGSAHDYVVSNVAKILSETQGIYEAVQAAAGLLDPFFTDPDAETKTIERFWKTKQGNRKFGVFFMEWQAARAALPGDSVSLSEQTRAFVRALREGLKYKLELHFLAQGISRPTIEQYASFAPMLDRNCPDTACIPNTCHSDRQEFTCPGGKGDNCRCGETKPANRREERKTPEKREGATKRCCGAPASWLGHYRSCKYNYGNVNSKSNPSRRYARAQINAIWICYVQETGVQDPAAGTHHLQTTTFRKRTHATDPEHTEHERIRSKEVFGMVLAAVKQYRGSDEGWAQWCRTTGVCPDCWGIRDQDKFRDFVAESGGSRSGSPAAGSQTGSHQNSPN